MKIQSPRLNGTVGQSFKVVGTYNPATGATGVEASLDGGVTWVAGTLPSVAGRPIWHVDFAGVAAGAYNVQARLTGVAPPAPSDAVNNVTVAAAPLLTLNQPPHLLDPGTADVPVQVTFGAGHAFTSIDLRLFNEAGGDESGFFLRVRVFTAGVGPHTLTGAAGEAHYVVATATTAAGAQTIASAGGIKLT